MRAKRWIATVLAVVAGLFAFRWLRHRGGGGEGEADITGLDEHQAA